MSIVVKRGLQHYFKANGSIDYSPRIMKLIYAGKANNSNPCSYWKPFARKYCSDHNKDKIKEQQDRSVSVGKYDIFRDDDSPIILDVDEEKQMRLEHPELFINERKEISDEFAGMNTERGLRGVYDIEELVDILRKQRAINIVVVKVPEEYKYVDHMVFCSGRSFKHMVSLASFVRRFFKRKCNPSDHIPRIEGEKARTWLALDLGNIALHILTKDMREKYDLETLWSVGSTYDTKFNEKEDPLITLLEGYTSHLHPIEDEEFEDEEFEGKRK